MPRPISTRQISQEPPRNSYKPAGVPLRELEEVVLTLDEFEALRLADHEGHYQDAVAERMGVPPPAAPPASDPPDPRQCPRQGRGGVRRGEGDPIRGRSRRAPPRTGRPRARMWTRRRWTSSWLWTESKRMKWRGTTPRSREADMPNRDGTGPDGKGPAQGRGKGCRNRRGGSAEESSRGRGRGQGGGRGRGRGRGRAGDRTEETGRACQRQPRQNGAETGEVE